MALTPEDVVNKRFQPTKFREGYDQDEVDDFLDEVVVELRRLNQENEDLRQRLIASESRIAELQRSGGGGPAPITAEQPGAHSSPPRARRPPVSDRAGRRRAPSTRPTPTTSSSWRAACTRSTSARASRSATRSSPRATPPQPASSPRQRPSSARRSRRSTRSAPLLEHRIDELRTFEREYRQKLKGYIEGQLRELDASNINTTGSYGN